MTTDRWLAVDMFTGEIITDNKSQRAIVRHQHMFEKLAALCEMLPARDERGTYQWSLMTRTERGMLNRAAKELTQAQVTDEELDAFIEWFNTYDWRGRRGQIPFPSDVVKLLTRFRSYRSNGRNVSVAEAWQALINKT